MGGGGEGGRRGGGGKGEGEGRGEGRESRKFKCFLIEIPRKFESLQVPFPRSVHAAILMLTTTFCWIRNNKSFPQQVLSDLFSERHYVSLKKAL